MKLYYSLILVLSIAAITSACGGGGAGGNTNGTQGSASVAPAGLAAQYSFDEDYGNRPINSSNQSENGLIYGASRVQGQFGDGLRFGFENAHVDIYDAFFFKQGVITIEAWINLQMVEAGKIYRIIGAYNYHGIAFQVNDGRLEVTCDGLSNHLGYITINPNEWTHVAFTSDGSEIITYVNGVEDQRSNVQLPVQQMENVCIGANWIYNGGNPMTDYVEEFPGAIDELRIWSATRTANDIFQGHDQQFINPTALSLEGLYWEGRYTFDEATDATAIDTSGLGNDGSIVDANRIAGYRGNGILFSADNSHIRVNDFFLFNNGVIDIGAWIHPTEIGAGQTYRIIGDYNYHGLCFHIRDGRLEVLFDNLSYLYGNATIPANIWTFVEFSSDGRDLEIYINGAMDASSNITFPIRSISSPTIGANHIYLGGNPMTDHIEEFRGIIDELGVVQGVLQAN